MAETTIDKLVIEISAEATTAAKQIKDFASALRGSASVLSETAKNLKAVGQATKDASTNVSKSKTETQGLNDTLDETGKSSEQASKGLKEVAKETKNAGNEAKQAGGRFSGLLGDIMRIAKYRAIRSFIKGLTTAIREGFNMFATWDKEMNGGMAGVANNVAAVTEKWTILKGQIGAAAGALFNSFAPVITFILDGLTKIIDVFQMVIRSLQGEYTYYHLIYKEAEATTGAAKELKRVLFGFDDLNVLPSQSGGGAATSGGSWAYERLPITSEFLNKIADASNKIKEFFGISDDGQKIIGGLVGVVGSLLGIKALGGLLSLLPRLIGGFKNKNQVLGEQSTKTATETSKVTQLATAFGAATAAAFGLKELLKNWKINIPTTVPSPVPQLQSAYNTATQWISRNVLTFKTSVAPATSAATSVWSAVQAVLSKTLVMPVALGVSGIGAALATLISSLQSQANARPVSIPTTIATSGLATGFSNYLNTFQNSLNKKPLTIGAKIAGVGTFASQVFNTSALEGWNIKSNPTASSYMSATDYVNYAESTGFNFTPQDKVVGALTAGAILAAPAALAAGAMGGASVTATELLKLLGVGAYANGGIIPNGVGTLFTAGEHGAEVVANLGHSTGVMNVDQMQEAVAEGNAPVVEALYAVLRAIENKDSNVYLDGAKVGQSVSRYQQNQARRGVAY